MRRTVLGLLAAFALLAGCGGGTTDPGATPPAAQEGVTVTHAFGTTTVPPNPRRIVALSFEEDALATIGLGTVARADNPYDSGRPYPWQQGTVDLTAGEVVVDASGTVNFERVAALRPDVILATNFYGLDEATYRTLSAIAPTVGYREAVGAADWEELAVQVGEAVGRPAEMAQQVSEVRDGIAGLAAELGGLEGKTYAGAYHYAPGAFRVNVNPEAQTARILGALGVTLDPDVITAAVDRSLSPERLSALDADLLVITFATPELRTALERDPLYAGLAVVKAGNVFVGDNYTATAGNNPTLLSIPWLLDQERPTLARVAAG